MKKTIIKTKIPAANPPNVIKEQEHVINIRLRDFTDDKDEPAYDVEVWIDGKPTMGGGDKQIFSLIDYEIEANVPKKIALNRAIKRFDELTEKIKRFGEE